MFGEGTSSERALCMVETRLGDLSDLIDDVEALTSLRREDVGNRLRFALLVEITGILEEEEERRRQ